MQATAAALAARGLVVGPQFFHILGSVLDYFASAGQDTSEFRKALVRMNEGLARSIAPIKMAQLLGNGVKAHDSVPMAIYCFLANPGSFEAALTSAIFLGGDTDTIACMSGALSGAALGLNAIPERWLGRITEPVYTVEKVRQIASALFHAGQRRNFGAC